MKRTVLGLALAATLLAAWFAPEDEGDVIAPAAARVARPNTPAQAAPEPVSALVIHPRVADDDVGSVFGAQQWQNPSPLKPIAARAPQAQPKAARLAAAATASARPLPIRLLGRFVDGGKVAYFLQVDERNVVAHVGEAVGSDYRLDSASGSALTFTYLPLNQQQVLAVGDTN